MSEPEKERKSNKSLKKLQCLFDLFCAERHKSQFLNLAGQIDITLQMNKKSYR